jgi:hypothetical protein
MAIIKSDEHYDVIRHLIYNHITGLKCLAPECSYSVSSLMVPKPMSSKSGLGRYNRMRGRMVSHWHKVHRNLIGATNA